MDIRQLKYFKTIVDEGNISRAAEVLHMAQPPLSQQLKRLEDELGTILIERYRKKWELTDTGKALYQHAVHMLQDMINIKQEIKEMEEGMRGNLNIGVSSSCVNFLPQQIKQFRENFPRVFIKIWKGDSVYLQNLLVKGEINLAFMLVPIGIEDYRIKRLKPSPFVVVMPKKWRMNFEDMVHLNDIIRYPFLMLGPMKGYMMYETILNQFHKHQFSPNIVMECKDISTLLSFVALEIGISIIPKSEIYGSFHHEIETIEIRDFSLYVDPAIVSLKEHKLTKVEEQFIYHFDEVE